MGYYTAEGTGIVLFAIYEYGVIGYVCFCL